MHRLFPIAPSKTEVTTAENKDEPVATNVSKSKWVYRCAIKLSSRDFIASNEEKDQPLTKISLAYLNKKILVNLTFSEILMKEFLKIQETFAKKDMALLGNTLTFMEKATDLQIWYANLEPKFFIQAVILGIHDTCLGKISSEALECLEQLPETLETDFNPGKASEDFVAILPSHERTMDVESILRNLSTESENLNSSHSFRGHSFR